MTVKKTVKKTVSLKRPSADAAAPSGDAAPAPSGGATIADRFKLDVPDAAPAARSTGIGTKIAVLAALAALAVAGILAYTLFGHWEFLKSA